MSTFKNKKIMGYLLILPQIIITLVFFIIPACNAVRQAFYYTDSFGLNHQFAQLHNFTDVVFQKGFLQSLIVSLGLALTISFITMSVGLGVAMLLKNRRRGKTVYKALLLWPYAVSPAIAALLWRFIFEPSGWFGQILHFFHAEFNYLVHPFQAFVVIVLAASWQQFSYNFLFFFAALIVIPGELLDAAILDGANSWQRFIHVIFPLLSPTTFFLIIMNVIYGLFETFGIIDILTHGGPGQSTTTLVYKIYKDGFVNMDLGGAAAQSLVLMALVMSLTLLQFRYLEKKVHYAS